MRLHHPLAAAALLVATLAGHAGAETSPGASGSDRMKSCNAEASSRGLSGAAWRSFMSGCLAGSTGSNEAGPAVPAEKPVRPTASAAAAPAPATAAQAAEQGRMKQCGAAWKAAKAAGQIPQGQTWPQYWSACNRRLKAAG